MKKLLAILLLFSIFSCVNKQSNPENNQESTTYYLIRHAEKDKSDPENRNPKLIKKGLKRAKKWKNHFKNVDLDAVYSTNYNRTIETATPTAVDKNLEIKSYNPQTLDIKVFLEKTKGQHVLIVGHSNTTPAFVNKIIEEDKYQSIDETINSNLYVVTIIDGEIKHELKSVD
ncbi:phosphoglycerate mutase family protein [Lacinutrix sp.]|uniref:SixA phosphatase family protein n=1 Tax=Lacinutrix sp. TaxID=1937692 RepID=UPI0025C01860|nr:phosphoglycerate mutase family protein [Lacinutrix sp.]